MKYAFLLGYGPTDWLAFHWAYIDIRMAGLMFDAGQMIDEKLRVMPFAVYA